MSTIEKVITDNSLMLKFVTSKQCSSPVFLLNNLKWSVHIGIIDARQFSCYVECNGNSSNIWNADVEITCKLLKNNNTYLTRDTDIVFQSNLGSWGWQNFVPPKELLEDYKNPFGKITLEVLVKIRSVAGLHSTSQQQNFELRDEQLSDVALVIDNRKLYVTKAVLACASPVFKTMFYSGFKESTAAEIPIYDVKFDEFEQFLQSIYNNHIDIDIPKLKNLLRLADRYDVRSVYRKCEQYLINSKTISIRDKLIFADDFQFSELHSVCLDSITNLADLQAWVPNIEEMGPATARALGQKMIIFGG